MTNGQGGAALRPMGVESQTIVNCYFRGQRVTGQQRFAHEIVKRLGALIPDLQEWAPSSRAERSSAMAWAELQARPFRQGANATLLSLTGRTPLRSRRHIVTIHDLFPLTHPEWYSARYAAIHSRLLRSHLKNASGFVVVSEPVKDQVLDLLERDVPIVVAPNAPSASLLYAGGPSDSESGVAAKYFLAVGSIEPRKNLAKLIAGYSRLPATLKNEVPLVIVGGSASIYASAGVPDSHLEGVRFLGRLSDQELSRLYANASAFVSTSLDEGFGLPLVEAAQSMGGSMVLSDIPVYRWVVGDADAIWIDPGSADSVADGLLRALDVTPNVDALRAIAGRFNWEESAQAVARVVASEKSVG